MIRLVKRYLAVRTLRGIGLAFLVVTGIILLIDFVEGTRNIGQDLDINSFQVMYLTLLKAPSLIEQTIPFIVLFGVMSALYGLNRRSELVVLRASGLSAWNFLAPPIYVACLLGLIWATIFNPIASRSLSLYQSKITATDSNVLPNDVIWLREGSETLQTLVRAESYDPRTRKLMNVTLSQSERDVNGEFNFRTRFDAASADLSAAGYWQLHQAKENTSDVLADAVLHDIISIPTQIRLEDITSQAKSEYIPPFWSLPTEISRTRRAGFSTIRLEMQWQKLLALPLTLVAMTVIAAGVSMHLTREGGTLRLIITGIAVGFSCYFANSIFNAFGESSTLPIIIAAWTIPIMTFFLGASYLLKIEDG